MFEFLTFSSFPTLGAWLGGVTGSIAAAQIDKWWSERFLASKVIEQAAQKSARELADDADEKRKMLKDTLQKWANSSLKQIVSEMQAGKKFSAAELELTLAESFSIPYDVVGVKTSKIIDSFGRHLCYELAEKDQSFFAFQMGEEFRRLLSRFDIVGQVIRLDNIREAKGASERTEVVIGQNLRPHDLTTGSLFPRNALFERLWSDDTDGKWSFEKWFSKNTLGIDRFTSTPVFWISGPSGGGKSALWLLLMRELLQRKTLVDHVTCLDTQGLKILLSKVRCSEISVDDRTVEYVFIDDLYSGLQYENWADEIRRIYGTFSMFPRIAIVTCGPTEQLKKFGHAFSSKEFSVCSVNVPLMEGRGEYLISRNDNQLWWMLFDVKLNCVLTTIRIAHSRQSSHVLLGAIFNRPNNAH